MDMLWERLRRHLNKLTPAVLIMPYVRMSLPNLAISGF